MQVIQTSLTILRYFTTNQLKIMPQVEIAMDSKDYSAQSEHTEIHSKHPCITAPPNLLSQKA